MAQIPYKIYLDESELPQAWYNLRADMKNKPAPLLNPATHQPMTFDELRPVFCDELVKQELDDTTPYFDIPGRLLTFTRCTGPLPWFTRSFWRRLWTLPPRFTTSLRATTPPVLTS